MTISETPLVYAWVRDLQIDEKYAYLLREYNWYLDSRSRARTTNLKRNDGSRKLEGFGNSVYLHQLIMCSEYTEKSNSTRHVRHLNHDRLDNRLMNLKFGSARDNALDHAENTGVTETSSGKWIAKAYLGGKSFTGRSRENRADAQFDYDMMTALYDYHGILPKTFQERRELPQYITLHRNGYKIRKTIDGSVEYFGYYPTLEDAVTARDKFIANGWVK
jgi:hypothetical protein